MKGVKIAPKLKCKRCQHEWRPRKSEVVCCPKCRSPYWNKDKVYKPRKERQVRSNDKQRDNKKEREES